MDARISKLRGEFLDLLAETAVPGYKKILEDPATNHKVRLEALRDLMGRFGFPELKASISQSVSGQVELDTLLKARETLMDERRRLAEGAAELKGFLNPGKESDALQEEVREEEGEEAQGQETGHCLPPEEMVTSQ